MNELTEYIRFFSRSNRGITVELFVNGSGRICDLSHVVSIELEFNDLECIRKACDRMNWTFVEGQRSFKWYGRWMDDYSANDAAYKLGIDPKDYGKCDHAIRVPGASYEIGLVEKEGQYLPVWDFFGSGGLGDVKPENGMKGFMQAYAVETAKKAMKKQGLRPTEKKLESGEVQLVAMA